MSTALISSSASAKIDAPKGERSSCTFSFPVVKMPNGLKRLRVSKSAMIPHDSGSSGFPSRSSQVRTW